MLPYNILKKSQAEKLISDIETYYGTKLDKLKKYKFYINDKTQKIYICNFVVEDLSLDKVSNFGLYFGTLHDNDRFRLSVDGSRFIRPKKNFIILTDKSIKSYICGESLFLEEIEQISKDNNAPFLIVIYKDENIGCVTIKDNEVISYLPKTRRLCPNKIF